MTTTMMITMRLGLKFYAKTTSTVVTTALGRPMIIVIMVGQPSSTLR